MKDLGVGILGEGMLSGLHSSRAASLNSQYRRWSSQGRGVTGRIFVCFIFIFCKTVFLNNRYLFKYSRFSFNFIFSFSLCTLFWRMTLLNAGSQISFLKQIVLLKEPSVITFFRTLPLLKKKKKKVWGRGSSAIKSFAFKIKPYSSL